MPTANARHLVDVLRRDFGKPLRQLDVVDRAGRQVSAHAAKDHVSDRLGGRRGDDRSRVAASGSPPAGGIQSRMAASQVSISRTGSLKGTVSPSSRKSRMARPSQGASKSKTDLALSICAKACPLEKRSPSAMLPLDDRGLGFGGALGGQIQRHSEQRLIHEESCLTSRPRARAPNSASAPGCAEFHSAAKRPRDRVRRRDQPRGGPIATTSKHSRAAKEMIRSPIPSASRPLSCTTLSGLSCGSTRKIRAEVERLEDSAGSHTSTEWSRRWRG